MRRLCGCHGWRPLSERESRLLPGLEALAQVPQAQGCEHCQGSGYRGRVGLYEFIRVDTELAALIHERCGEAQIEQHLQSRRQSLVQAALARLEAGETSLEEVLGAVQQG